MIRFPTGAPFAFLGFKTDGKLNPQYEFYFLADAIGYPTMLRKASIDNSGSMVLFTLAPPQFWYQLFPPTGKGKCDWKRANNWVAHMSFRAGVYTPKTDGPIVHKDLKGKSGG